MMLMMMMMMIMMMIMMVAIATLMLMMLTVEMIVKKINVFTMNRCLTPWFFAVASCHTNLFFRPFKVVCDWVDRS